MAPQWLLVDFGKVISRPQPAETLTRMAVVAGLDLAAFVERYWAARADYDRGLGAAEYWSAVLGREVSPDDAVLAELVDLDVASWAHLNEDTLDVLGSAHAGGARLALLSNAPHEVADAVRGHPALGAFEHLFFSADLGLVKPDPAIFAAVLAVVGSPAGEVTFVDDLPENIAAAHEAGLRTALFTTAEDLRRQLSA